MSAKYSYRNWTLMLMYLAGGAIRYWLATSKYQSIIQNHIEVSTPLNSWKRVSEGLHLQSKGINPYSGDLLHEAPVFLYLYKNLLELTQLPTAVIFIAVDILTAVLLYYVARQYMFHLFVHQEKQKKEYAPGTEEYWLTSHTYINSPFYVVAAFLFHPYTILNCVGFSTVVFHNLFLAFFLLNMVSGNLLSVLGLVLCSLMSLYPVILLVPLGLTFLTLYKDKSKTILLPILFASGIYLLSFLSYRINNNDLSFLENVYGFILTVPDLQPNIGLFWYFFTEMFDHFRELFIWSFQINATILYLLPLSVKFRKDPFLLTVALLFLISVFKSYPCIGDLGFAMCLLPCFTHLYSFVQQGFLVGIMFLITTALGPILWHLWIYSNSANANFYFGVTLAFAIAQIFLLTDLLFGYLKREFCLRHGKERKLDGKDAVLVLE